MSSLPPGIFFVNGDINYPPAKTFIGAGMTIDTYTELTTQLFIDESMTKAEFDARVEVDPDYPLIVHLQGLRILVIVPEYYDHHNKHFADVIMFFHFGMVDVERNHWGLGPPGKDYDAQRINMYALLRAGKEEKHGACIEIPWHAGPRCDQCDYPFFCDRCHTFSGMKICKCGCDCKCGCGTSLVDNQGIKVGIIHAPNCDNEYHNRNFIDRK